MMCSTIHIIMKGETNTNLTNLKRLIFISSAKHLIYQNFSFFCITKTQAFFNNIGSKLLLAHLNYLPGQLPDNLCPLMWLPMFQDMLVTEVTSDSPCQRRVPFKKMNDQLNIKWFGTHNSRKGTTITNHKQQMQLHPTRLSLCSPFPLSLFSATDSTFQTRIQI